MRLRYTVSLERELEPVLTTRGDFDVPNARLGARRALEAAVRDHPNRRWRSVVIVLEKRDPPDTASPS